MELLITAKNLKAALLATSKQDIRYYLNGVLIEATPSEVRLIATNGHHLVCIRDHAKNKINAPLSLIVPRDVIEGLRIGKKDAHLPLVIELPAPGRSGHRIGFPGSMREFTPVDGRFPDYRRVIPKETSGEVGQFDPALLATIKDALDVHTDAKKGNPYMRVHHNGSAGALLTGDSPDFVGVLMPVRMTDAKTDAPLCAPWTGWVHADTSVEMQAAA